MDAILMWKSNKGVDFMGNTFFFPWEVKLMQFLQAYMNDIEVKIASIVSMFGEELFLVLVLGFVYWIYDKKTGIKVGMNMMLVNITYPLIKNVALRRRPYMDHKGIECLKLIDKDADAMDIYAQGYSFPSGHSSNSAVAMGSLAYFFKHWIFKVLAIVIPLLVGISRFCLGVHYPTDVLCGWAIGYGVVFLMPFLESKFKNPRTLYFIIFALGCVGVFYCKTNDYYSGMGMLLGLILGNMFEEKYVNFDKPANAFAAALRLVGGIAIFFGLNTLLKMPFPADLLASATAAQFAIRFARYAIIIFIEVGVYPLLFGKIFKKK